MRLSLSWLGDFVDLGGRAAGQIAEDLTLRTALIEGIETRGDFSDEVVVGKVLECARHPHADRLTRCVVDVGGDTLEVICGAPNVAAGQTVPVAKVGAALAGGVRLKKTKIRGLASHGMICSEKELDLGDDQDGIIVLEEGLEPGRPFRECAGVADTLFEIDNKSITHRPDLWGHEGFGRELAAIYGLELRLAQGEEALCEGSGPLAVRIEAGDLCGRYCALFVRGRLAVSAPGWLRWRLRHCGLRPLWLAVDVSNYVMLEIGQPTHPFDRKRLQGGVIRVRRAARGERLVTLDGEERALPEGACVIADAERAVAIAGVIGGRDSGIDASTEEAVVESASFDALSVRATSSALGLRTEALARFEKALDPALAERGVRRYAALLRAAAPGVEIAREFVRAGDAAAAPIELRLRPRRLAMKLGVDVGADAMESSLVRLGFAVARSGEDLRVQAPSFRATRDIRCEDDLIEEVGRIHGYHLVPEEIPAAACRPVRLEAVSEAWRACVRLLCGRLGFTEVCAYPYVEESVLERSGGAGEERYLCILNPLQQSARRLRRSQVPGMIEFVDRNIKAAEEVRLFECGRVYQPAARAGELPREPTVLCAAWGERTLRRGADDARRDGLVLRRLKGALEEVGEELRRPLRFELLAGGAARWLHPARSAAVFAGAERVGEIGQVHPD
ncbi:MAG: phenylalanine--tRNA ligase subunit beta, partial [Planctomycetes bacterium]|nr:phenylalanine--tRNA ligase subunit beta [Planctomycetota bacterium]